VSQPGRAEDAEASSIERTADTLELIDCRLLVTFNTVTGDSGSLSDPMVLWDPDTQRFYYNVWNIGTQTMDWGFSKTANPTSTTAFCNYITGFGYATTEFPDYPKLGQTKGLLLIGVNHYPSLSSAHTDRTDVLWIQKPQGSDPVTTCPANTFNKGKFTDLRSKDGNHRLHPGPRHPDRSVGHRVRRRLLRHRMP
jgi:hypothetical protein